MRFLKDIKILFQNFNALGRHVTFGDQIYVNQGFAD
jgi:hypothetical protein